MRTREAAILGGLALALMSGSAEAALVTFNYVDPSTSPNLGFQRYTVTATGTYDITAYGAQGGGSAAFGSFGQGAQIGGEFTLIKGEVLTIVVGGKGAADNSQLGFGGGGGGGTFVLDGADQPLVVAGGGGGGFEGGAGQTTTAGGTGSGGGSAVGGQGGVEGAGGSSGTAVGYFIAGGGGGFYSNGSGGASGGKALIFGAEGGSGANEQYIGNGPAGGFGGGGGALPGGGGGGGGYSGGGGGGGAGGGGGGSFLAASVLSADLVETAGENAGNGFVTIDDLSPVSTVPLPSSAPMFGAALIALGAAGYGLKRKSNAAAQA